MGDTTIKLLGLTKVSLRVYPDLHIHWGGKEVQSYRRRSSSEEDQVPFTSKE